MLISHIKFGKHNFKNKVCFLKKTFYKGNTTASSGIFWKAHILHPFPRPTSPHGHVQHNPKKIDCIKKVITAFLCHLKIFGFHINVEK